MAADFAVGAALSFTVALAGVAIVFALDVVVFDTGCSASLAAFVSLSTMLFSADFVAVTFIVPCPG